MEVFGVERSLERKASGFSEAWALAPPPRVKYVGRWRRRFARECQRSLKSSMLMGARCFSRHVEPLVLRTSGTAGSRRTRLQRRTNLNRTVAARRERGAVEVASIKGCSKVRSKSARCSPSNAKL